MNALHKPDKIKIQQKKIGWKSKTPATFQNTYFNQENLENVVDLCKKPTNKKI